MPQSNSGRSATSSGARSATAFWLRRRMPLETVFYVLRSSQAGTKYEVRPDLFTVDMLFDDQFFDRLGCTQA
jgi:hypothetical protein